MIIFNKRKRKKQAFTLLELILIISILSLLALIAIPQYGKVKRNAAITSDIRSAQIITNSIIQLASEDKLIFPQNLGATIIINNNPADDTIGDMISNTGKSISETIYDYLHFTPIPSLNEFKNTYFIATITTDARVFISVKNSSMSENELIQVYPAPSTSNIYYK